MAMETKTAVYFDLDGTLVDTTYLHTFAWWRALDEAGVAKPMAAIHPLIGMGSTELLTHMIGRDDQSISAAHGRWFAAMHPSVRPLPGAAALIKRVARGAKVVVVTSAKKRDVDALLRPLDCEAFIADVVDGDDVGCSKPAPDAFVVALRRTGADPARSLAVGDSVWDIKAAAASGMPCIGLQTGGIARRDLERAGAAAVYRDACELMHHWGQSPLAGLLSVA
jgi:HAD superfamily hydrolase (TIGR01509 family)